MSIVQGAALDSGIAYEVKKSIRLRAANSARLSRTPAGSGTSRRVMSFSAYIKRGALGAVTTVFASEDDDTAAGSVLAIRFTAADQLEIFEYTSGYRINAVSTQRFRDPTSHLHLLVSFDTNQSVFSDVLKVWVNGQQVTSWATGYCSTGFDMSINNGAHKVGIGVGLHVSGAHVGYFDGELSEVHFIDGQALTPTAFGETDPATRAWIPKKYAGTYGANGFYLDFSDGSNLTNLCLDRSGNGNHWTATGVSLTSGPDYDWLDDTPTNNFATFSPLAVTNALGLLKNAALTLYNATNYSYTKPTTFGIASGKWYVEFTATAANGYYPRLGVVSAYENVTSMYGPGYSTTSYGIDSYAGDKSNNSVPSAYGSAIMSGDVVGVALDMDNGKIWFSKNGVWFASGDPFAGTNPAFSGLAGTLCFAASTYMGEVSLNAGQRPFASSPPAGFVAPCTKNLNAATPITTSGTFTGNSSADGPVVWLNGVPTALTINGNAVTFATHADKLAGGFKLRTSSSSYNTVGSNTYTVSTTGAKFKYANAQGNP